MRKAVAITGVALNFINSQRNSRLPPMLRMSVVNHMTKSGGLSEDEEGIIGLLCGTTDIRSIGGNLGISLRTDEVRGSVMGHHLLTNVLHLVQLRILSHLYSWATSTTTNVMLDQAVVATL